VNPAIADARAFSPHQLHLRPGARSPDTSIVSEMAISSGLAVALKSPVFTSDPTLRLGIADQTNSCISNEQALILLETEPLPNLQK
jgi:hypothetical protein